ncbi:MAG: GNAT family N-acetyltransferase [Cyclobacteriaceae bacterium]|nr:GNAT family N-acetyltransferase [Cyclobacteriaceae bacterium HetDA_MAG_MS6]
MNSFVIQVANSAHVGHVEEICRLIEESAKQRGTGIAKRSPDYIQAKINEHKAIIALEKRGELAGFCYIESWGNKTYVANSGLIVNSKFRGEGLATKIKKKAFEHSRKMFPDAKLFGLTTSLPVMKINSDLGYHPVTFDKLTSDDEFWKGCMSCVNYEILQSKSRSNCLCTAMLYDPQEKKKKKWDFIKKSRLYSRFMNMKKKKMTSTIKVL